jgi:hypothetical protein
MKTRDDIVAAALQEMPTTGTVKSRLGDLKLVNGFPTQDTVAKLYDDLDFQRACQAYIWALPYTSMGEPVATSSSPFVSTGQSCPSMTKLGSRMTS